MHSIFQGPCLRAGPCSPTGALFGRWCLLRCEALVSLIPLQTQELILESVFDNYGHADYRKAAQNLWIQA